MADVLNIDDLISKLNKLSKADMTEALTKSCLLVENDAKQKAPIATGQLRSSITHEIEGTTGVVGTNVEYAPYVEIGTGIYSSKGDGRQNPWSYQDASGKWHSTVGQKPQPFLNPALMDNADEIVNIFEDKIKETVKK